MFKFTSVPLDRTSCPSAVPSFSDPQTGTKFALPIIQGQQTLNLLL